MPFFSNKWTPLLIAVICGILVWNHFRERETPPPETSSPLSEHAVAPPPLPPTQPIETSESSISDQTPSIVESAIPQPSTNISPRSLAANLIAPEESIDSSEDLSAVDSAILNYHTVHGENPTGSNAEITTALFINNPKQIKLEVPAGSSINAQGQLCDRWGTPYFFHQLSATEMEIRSAGPDREMWTGDDSQM